MAKFDLYGFYKFEKALIRILEKEYPEEMEKQLKRVATGLVADIQLNTPVDTGTLKRSWKVGKVKNGTVEVGTNVEYAPMVEYGYEHESGGFVPGQHMVEKSVKQLEDRLPKELEQWLQQLLKELKL